MDIDDDRIRKSADASSIKKLQIILLEVFYAAKESKLRFGKPFLRVHFCTSEFERTGNVRGLEKPIARWFDVGDEFGARGEDGERFFEQGGQLGLPVVIVDLELVESRKLVRLGQEKFDDLLKKRVVDILRRADEVFVNHKAFVRYINLAQEEKHATEYASSRFSVQVGVFLFVPDQRSSMNTMIPVKANGSKGVFQFCYLVGDVDVLVVEDHADEIVPRRHPVWFIAARFVDEYADFTRSHCRSLYKTKARIAPRLRQESFPLAGDSGFRLCRLVFYQKTARMCKGAVRIGCNEIFMQSQRVLAAEDAKDAELMPRSRPASGL